MKKVYLAGPTVFHPNAEGFFAAMKGVLADYGLLGVAPIDNQAHLLGIPPGPDLNAAIYEADIGIMRTVDAAIFDISPFRNATECDAGTAFEAGYCRCLGLPMTGWTTQGVNYPELVEGYVRKRYGRELVAEVSEASKGAKSGSLRDPDGILVHSVGLYQNLMIQIAIENAGGFVSSDPDWSVAFGKAAAHLASVMDSLESLTVSPAK